MKPNFFLMMFFSAFIAIAAYKSLSGNSKEVNQQTVADAIDTTISDTTSPHIQLVFALDATGSMAGLIGAAKEKIWSIASSLSQSSPAPKLEIGMVFYRDKGDVFITKLIPLSTRLDDMYDKLMDIQADNGGDQPESVNQGLYEAVNKIEWSQNSKTVKNLFLVGDCPPHMDYSDDVKYYETCKDAHKKGIIINTILMGNNSEARLIWQEIARCGEGEYLEMNMNANDFVVKSPYDKEIEDMQRKLDDQRLYYGDAANQTKNVSKKMQAAKFYDLNNEATNSKRAECNMSSEVSKDAYYEQKELYNDLRKSKVKLADIKESEMPENLKKMTSAERKKYVEEQLALRNKLEKDLSELTKKRQDYIQKELVKMDSTTVKNSFNSTIYDKVQKEASKKGYKMEGKAKY